MSSQITLIYLGIYLYAWTITTTDAEILPREGDVHWMSLDFKTILTWNPTLPDDLYTVLYSDSDDNWKMIPECIHIPHPECDLTNYLMYKDRNFSADIQTKPVDEMEYLLEDPPHIFSPHFNPYRQSKISAAVFSVHTTQDGRIILNISDPLTPFHQPEKQLTIRDIFQTHLNYKISYYKAGSTGKRDIIIQSSVAELSQLDAAQRYCFMVAVFIPSRPKAFQLGDWSEQQCMVGDESPFSDLSLGVLICGLFILFILIIIVVTVFCCRRCHRRRNKSLQPSAVV
ncbi:hypothetical protein LDENG_00134300 [Lucifuga dentata]|nr:hypothetical protein LDENG_00134300 [Lucifuga dentata]